MRLLTVCAAVVLLSAGGARAEDAQAKAAADALFDEGKRLMSEGEIDAACVKFAASRTFSPRLGVILNLASCYEAAGQTASAWTEFRSALALASKTGDARAELASERVALLEKRLPRLLLKVAAGVDAKGMAITRDGAPVVEALLGTAFPVDPGEHVIVVTAAGKGRTVKVVAVEGKTVTVELLAPTAWTDTSAAKVSGTGLSPVTPTVPQPPAPKNAKAEKLNDEGRASLFEGKADEAAAKFRAAIVLSPDPRYYFNLCVTALTVNQEREALAACDAALAHGPSPELKAKIETMKKRITVK
jgi:tetratricopeptide (TPR) repeat protein